jgi:hypothetical protein
MLKELYDLIMLSFTQEERANILIYELQTYIIEKAVQPKDHYAGMRFTAFFNWLVSSIRTEIKLWVKNSPTYINICKYFKLLKKKMEMVQDKAKSIGKETKMPPVYFPNFDDSYDQIEKSNKVSAEKYSQ